MDGDFTWADFQRMENGAGPAPLAFTASDLEEAYGPNGPDEDDVAALNLAMDRDMADRTEYWQDRAYAAESRLRELEGGDNDEENDGRSGW